MSQAKYIRRAETRHDDEHMAVSELAEKLYQSEMAGILFFCSPEYDLQKLSLALNETFTCPVIGCTTAGQIGTSFSQEGIVAVSFSSRVFRLHSTVLEPLCSMSPGEIERSIAGLESSLEFFDEFTVERMFGFLLIDGLSVMEEQTIATIYNSVKGMSVIGGSAADNLRFEKTYIFAEGSFKTDSAVFTVIETLLPFKTFKLQHFVPSDLDMVITEADPANRIVTEINGETAGKEYADILGLQVDNLSPQVFAAYPLMLQIDNEWFIRSIAKLNDDYSLSFACAIDVGLPLTVAKGVGFLETLEQQVEEIKQEFTNIELTIGCDCAFRLIEMLQSGIKEQVEQQLQQLNFIGFNTYGEQYNAIHVNQTLTAVVIGE